MISSTISWLRSLPLRVALMPSIIAGGGVAFNVVACPFPFGVLLRSKSVVIEGTASIVDADAASLPPSEA